MAQVPGFPRRSVPNDPKSPLRARRDLPQPFFKTANGRRMLGYGLVFVVLVGVTIDQFKRQMKSPQETAESRPVKLEHPPRQFVSGDILHQLRTLEDFSQDVPPIAIATAVGFLNRDHGPASRPASDWTDLEVDEALAFPEAFRGGLVRIRGPLMGIDTRVIPHPAIPSPEGFTYRGWLLHGNPRDKKTMVTWQTASRPPDVDKNTVLEVEGVFLQAIQYEDAKGNLRSSPFIVAGAIRVVPEEAKPKGLLDTLFVPILVSLIILILLTTLYLFQKARRPAAPRYTVRPPGPGR